MITEDYVSFETAKLLKEKGFNEKCAATYNLVTSTFEVEEVYQDWTTRWKAYVSAPTLQMAMKWLREEHNTYIKVSPDINDSYNFYCDVYTKGSESWDSQNVELGDFSTYEQACEDAIKYCLENLI